MKTKLTKSEYETIENLAHQALSSPNKAEAKRFIVQIGYIAGGLMGYASIVRAELMSALEAACGRVSDRERKVDYVNNRLFTLSGQVEQDD